MSFALSPWLRRHAGKATPVQSESKPGRDALAIHGRPGARVAVLQRSILRTASRTYHGSLQSGRLGRVKKRLVFGLSISVATDRINQPRSPAIQLQVKTLLNRIQHFAGFDYQDIRLRSPRGELSIELALAAHQRMDGKCSECRRPAPAYDRLPEQRWWLSVPLWGIVTWFQYRRMHCRTVNFVDILLRVFRCSGVSSSQAC
jgi:hypothetical protein